MSIEVKMPRLSDTMEQGTVVRWAVKPGQKVKSGDVIADIETDKATMELQTFDDGTVAELAVAEGATVKVGTTIMKLDEAGAPSSASKGAPSASAAAATADSANKPEPAKPAPVATRTAVVEPPPAAAPARQHTNGERIFASPLARKIAEETGVDLHNLHGSGPSGRIIRKDVEAAAGGTGFQPVSRQTAQPGRKASPEPAKISNLSAGNVPGFALPSSDSALAARSIALSNMRATIAKRLVQSKATIPHYQVTVAVRMDALLNLRAQLNEQLASQGVKLSVNDFLVRACAIAMHQHPHVNSRWMEPLGQPGTGGNPTIELLPDVNIGVAIALPLNEKGEGGGLVVATLRNADRIGLRQISSETKRLGDKARNKGLSIEEMSDSTFTISNLGMFGVEHFTAIINPPNAAILAVGAAVEQPVVQTDASGAKKLGIGHIMQMTMSSDHRIVDGAMAAQYLATVRELLEKPATLLV
jgi:pyruvate dehydrogenase E2 component (dihydrolipoamide acetyltransferase)